MTTQECLDLIRKFREVTEALAQDRDEKFALLDVKFFLLAALNDVDRALAYGNPGRGIDDLLSTDRAGEPMSTHTLGPWTLGFNRPKDARHDAVAFINAGKKCVAKCDGDDYLANAYPITAAPDLLEALKALVERGTDSPEHQAAEAAIAKAEGK